jgi:hypothetical protein
MRHEKSTRARCRLVLLCCDLWVTFESVARWGIAVSYMEAEDRTRQNLVSPRDTSSLALNIRPFPLLKIRTPNSGCHALSD